MEGAASLRLQILQESRGSSGQLFLRYEAMGSILLATNRGLTFYLSQSAVRVLRDRSNAHTEGM